MSSNYYFIGFYILIYSDKSCNKSLFNFNKKLLLQFMCVQYKYKISFNFLQEKYRNF